MAVRTPLSFSSGPAPGSPVARTGTVCPPETALRRVGRLILPRPVGDLAGDPITTGMPRGDYSHSMVPGGFDVMS
jgi:hypothetical protein